jgi:hypothetical protein
MPAATAPELTSTTSSPRPRRPASSPTSRAMRSRSMSCGPDRMLLPIFTTTRFTRGSSACL